MPNYTLSPAPWLQFTANDGVTPAVAGKVYTYVAGGTTPATTYSSSSGIANSNPITLDGAGRATIFLAPSTSYRFDLYDADGAFIDSQDNVSSVPAGASFAVGSMSTNFTTTSATNVDVTGATVNLTTTGRNVFLLYTGPAIVTGGTASFSFSVDGVDLVTVYGATTNAVSVGSISVSALVTPVAGAHTFQLRAKITGGNTLTMSGASTAVGTLFASESSS